MRSEVKQLDKALQEYDELTVRLIDLSEDCDVESRLRETLEEFESLAVRAKQDAYTLVLQSGVGGSEKSSSEKSSRSGSYVRSRKKVNKWLTQSVAVNNGVPTHLPAVGGQAALPD